MCKTDDIIKKIRAEISGRSSVQHTYFISNIGICGAVLSFALTKEADVYIRLSALLIIPLISFCFFMLWYHQALWILERDIFIKKIEPEEKSDKDHCYSEIGKRFRPLTFAVGILGGFFLISFFSLIFYFCISSGRQIFVGILAAIPMFLVLIIFGIWVLDFYYEKNIMVCRKEN